MEYLLFSSNIKCASVDKRDQSLNSGDTNQGLLDGGGGSPRDKYAKPLSHVSHTSHLLNEKGTYTKRLGLGRKQFPPNFLTLLSHRQGLSTLNLVICRQRNIKTSPISYAK